MNRILENATVHDEARPGDYLVYFDDIESLSPVHVGRVMDDLRVRSKWGPYGPVVDHPPGMVPRNYGDFAFFFRLPGDPTEQTE
jgi:hypothetical protein